MNLDLSVYLVTGRDLLPPGKDYFESLEESIQGGVTVVQIREKNSDTAEFLQIASRSKEICDRYAVPLLINDRVDIALAINAAGVHVGQSDMPVASVRRLLPPGSIIGLSCHDIQHVRQAIAEEVTYVGIGPVWSTQTKSDAASPLGVRGARLLLDALEGTSCQAVAIGGITSRNVLRTLHGAVSLNNKRLDGIAVVSEIMRSPEPKKAAEHLCSIIKQFKSQQAASPKYTSILTDARPLILDKVVNLIEQIKRVNPLVHHITNNVVVNQSANMTLALGASPLMAPTAEEMEDLSKIPGSLLVNIGTLQTQAREAMKLSGYFANLNRKPVVLDPVGVGATHYRKEIVKELLNVWHPCVIKGNAGELAALAGSSEVEAKGVDSVGPGFKDPVSFVRNLAKREKCVIVMTGATDYIASAIGNFVISISNGHPILGNITGSGCLAGTSIAAYCAVASAIHSFGNPDSASAPFADGDMLLAALAGILMITISAEKVMANGNIGPGFFLNHLMDQVAAFDPVDVLSRAKIQLWVG